MPSAWDQFIYMPWDKYAGVAGKVATVTCVGMGILGCFVANFVLIQVYVIFVGLLLAVLELPIVYACIPPCGKLKDKLLDDLYFKNGFLRGVVYVGLSIIMFLETTLAILSGIVILLTSITYFFKACADRQDAADNRTLGGGGGENVPYDKFGTFNSSTGP